MKLRGDVTSGIVLPYTGFVRSLYYYREYLRQSVARDLRKKYKRTTLGYFWSMLNPILMMLVLTIVFSSLLPRREDYMLYLFSALLAWQYFAQTVNESLDSIKSNLKIIQQVPIPKYMFAISIALSNVINFLLSLVALVLVSIVIGRPLPLTTLLLPIMFIPLFLMTISFSLLFAAGNVFFEDVKHLTRVMLSAWYFLTPVLYGPDMMPEKKKFWLQLNPLFHPVNFMREIIYQGQVPDWGIYCMTVAFGFLLLGVSLHCFRKADDKFLYFI